MSQSFVITPLVESIDNKEEKRVEDGFGFFLRLGKKVNRVGVVEKTSPQRDE